MRRIHFIVYLLVVLGGVCAATLATAQECYVDNEGGDDQASGLSEEEAVASLSAIPGSCKTVRFSDVGWTDITATTALVSRVLKGLGYEPSEELLSVPVTYASLKNKDVDVFLGNWMPTMEADLKPYLDDGSVEVITPANLEGAKYTLAVPSYTYDAGLKSFGDIAAFRDVGSFNDVPAASSLPEGDTK